MVKNLAIPEWMQAGRTVSTWWVWLLILVLLALLVLWFFSLRRVEADDGQGMRDELKDRNMTGSPGENL